MAQTRTVQIIDSHTAGEPTRVVVAGGPDLKGNSMAELREDFRNNYDWFRSAVADEPRGSEAIVGAFLCRSPNPGCAAGVIFFNNVGYIGMCGHGTIGLGVTLLRLGRIAPGIHRIDTPVGMVSLEVHSPSEATVENVPSYRLKKDVTLHVDGFGKVTGDIAWGGNWFFITPDIPCEIIPKNLRRLTDFSWSIRHALTQEGITGAKGQEIDHVELSAPPGNLPADARTFVLCPGGSYDRSPCGTGTSAKMACLYADGKFNEGDIWRQASVIGTVFEGTIKVHNGTVVPRIKGSAFVNAETNLILDENDPFCWGIRL